MSETYKSEEEAKWEPGAGCDKLALVRIVLERKDDENQDGGANELVEELAGCAKHGAWVCCEDASGRGLGRCNSAVRVICIDQAVVVAIDDTSSAECTKELGEPVHGETSPWKLAEHARCEADSWVQECTRVTSDVDTQHEADTPSEGDSGPVSEAISTWCGSIIGSEKCLCESGITCGSQHQSGARMNENMNLPNRTRMKVPQNSAKGSLKAILAFDQKKWLCSA